MKKIIIILLISILVLSIASCGGGNASYENNDQNGDSQLTDTPSGGDDSADTDDTPLPDGDKEESEDIYSRLGGLANREYGLITLDITSTTSHVSLGARYEISADEVRYSVEKLNRISIDDIASNPASYKKTLTGVATVKNGVIVSINGDDVELPEYTEMRGLFSFSESCFRDAKDENGVFTADIVDPDSFFNRDVDVSGARISVVYTDEALVSITVSYSTSAATVAAVYTFNV